jgi:hypothetical protein
MIANLPEVIWIEFFLFIPLFFAGRHSKNGRPLIRSLNGSKALDGR